MPKKLILPAGFIYPLCQVCGAETPTHSKKGAKLTHKRRLDMKTCGSGECFGSLVSAQRKAAAKKNTEGRVRLKVVLPVLVNPIDIIYNKFLYAGRG